MKLRFLSIIPFLALSGCTANEKHYYNVRHQWSSELQEHIVYVENKEYKLKVENVHYVFVDDYPCTDTCSILAYNEFYVKGSSYNLFVYKINK